MAYKSKAELESKVIRVANEDYAKIVSISRLSNESIGETIHRVLGGEKLVLIYPDDYIKLDKISQEQNEPLSQVLHDILQQKLA